MTFDENGADREPPPLGGFFNAREAPELTISFTPRRKDAKNSSPFASLLCGFAPLHENFFGY